MALSMGASATVDAASREYGSALMESNFAGSTTNAQMVIAAIATALNPSAARGIEDS
jgi:hypothetical protein